MFFNAISTFLLLDFQELRAVIAVVAFKMLSNPRTEVLQCSQALIKI